jgi:hypothetical protein
MVGDADAVAEWSVGAGDDRAYARHPSRGRGIDANNASGWNFCARQCGVQHAGAAAIDGVARAATQLVARVAPRKVHHNVRGVRHCRHCVSAG